MAELTALETNMEVSVSQENNSTYIITLQKTGVHRLNTLDTFFFFYMFTTPFLSFSINPHHSTPLSVLTHPSCLLSLLFEPSLFQTHTHTMQIRLFSILALSLISPFPRVWEDEIHNAILQLTRAFSLYRGVGADSGEEGTGAKLDSNHVLL